MKEKTYRIVTEEFGNKIELVTGVKEEDRIAAVNKAHSEYPEYGGVWAEVER